MRYTYLIALGSNIEPREENLIQGTRHLMEIGEVSRVSDMVESNPVGIESKNQFLNNAALLHTESGPEEVLVKLKGIEIALGRIPQIDGSRIIDLDIIAIADYDKKTEVQYISS